MLNTEYDLRVPSTYLHENRGANKTVLILLHGFSDSASSFLRRAFGEPYPDFEIFAPNAPFPQPQRQGGEWKEAYAWYFADLAKDKIYIHPAVAAGAVAGLVGRLGLAERPKVLCGFSQGGYFLPHLASELKNVRRLIAVGAGFHPEYFARYHLRLPVSAIHGTDDEVIPLGEAKDDFRRLGEWNTGGIFTEVPGMSHALNEEGRARLRELLAP